MTRVLEALFNPTSVAIVGASNDQTKYGNWLSVQALKMEGKRRVYLVNRKGKPVLGHPTLTSLRAIEGGVDLVVLSVPVSSFEQTVADALATGARALVGITAGFAELGSEGRALQDRVTRRVQDAGAVLLGPNCLGVMDSTSGLTVVSNPMPGGPVSLFSQSGNMAIELSQRLLAHHLGFARFASLGNQADLHAADLIRDSIAHAGTKVIAVYCEDFGEGREFVDAAAEARRRGKPVVLLTVGGSEASARSAQSHTGALTSGSAVIDAACRAAGIYRVSSPRELADVAALLLSTRSRSVRSVAIFADSGGHASIAADIAAASGLSVPEFSAQTQQALRAECPPSAGVRNPIDGAGAGEQDITSFLRILDIALGDPEIDAVMMTGYFGGYGEYGEELGRLEIETAGRMGEHIVAAGKPVAVHTMFPESGAARALAAHGIPIYHAVDDAARALGVIARTHEPRLVAKREHIDAPLADEGYWTARSFLAKAGIAFPRAELVDSLAAARAAAERIGYPVVLKAMGLLHKSDRGGVAVGLVGPDELSTAFQAMNERLKAPHYSVEAMVNLHDAVELIAGVQTDPRFGPLVLVGLGGVFTEVLRDVVLALAPVDAMTARKMLESLRGAAMLHGARGRPAVAIDAAAAAVATLSELAMRHPEIRELEVNPLLATPAAALGLDARVVLAAPAPSAGVSYAHA